MTVAFRSRLPQPTRRPRAAAQHHRVHHLTIGKTLQRHEPGQPAIFIGFHEQGDQSRDHFGEHEEQVESDDVLHVGTRIRGAMFPPHHYHTHEAEEEQQIGEW